MPIGKKISEFEKGQITAFNNENLSIAEIARRLNRSRHVVSSFLELKENYGKKTRSGRPRIMTERESVQSWEKFQIQLRISAVLGMNCCQPSPIWLFGD